MPEHLLLRLAGILVLGIAAQWIAWRLRLPSILLMLIFGIFAGPVTGFIDPDEIFGDLLLPIISISVAIILFEGGLSLKISDLRESRICIRNLITVGALITWMIGSVGAHLTLNMDWDISVLLGAILVVTGPTVISPLLRHVRPIGRTGPVLKWEGIMIDPIGALLAVLVFQAISSGRLEEATTVIVFVIFKTILIGVFVGGIGALAMIWFLKRYWIPDYLQSPVALMVVIIGFALSDLLQEESGLLTAVVMGIMMANQKKVSLRNIIEFKENLGILLVSGLFILLASRLQTDGFSDLGIGALAFLGIMILIARPLAVAVSTQGSQLTRSERVFVSWMAPRGIVAASVASVFALRLAEQGHPQADLLVPATFCIILGTAAIYGIAARPLAFRLGIANPHPHGFIIVGAHVWAREIAAKLQQHGFDVTMVDTNWENLSRARSSGIKSSYASILSQNVLDEIDLGGIGQMLALTPNDSINTLATMHFAPVLGKANVYQLAPQGQAGSRHESVPQDFRGRILFGSKASYPYLSARFSHGAVVKGTNLTDKFAYDDFMKLYGEDALPMFQVSQAGDITIFTAESPPAPKVGRTLISLVDPVPETHNEKGQEV
ncbi:MAG: sodium:proton antiporter [Dehalococcoidia bacterium]|nr:sodium:proton antiporter [Dehalococcoidia bacterium]